MKKLNFFQNRPKAARIDTEAYLGRIGLSEKEPNLQYLKALQRAHLLSIPFENLDIHYRSKIILDYQKIFDKVVTRKRGGFCHELNGLFYHLLYHLGFDCYIIAAQFWNEEKRQFGRPFEHMAIVVSLNGEDWYVDVGFGDGPTSPLVIKKGQVQVDYTKYWKFETDPDENFILKLSDNTTHFKTRTLFTTKERQLIEFMEICEFQQNSIDSIFTQQKLITQLTKDGRVTLTDRKLKILSLGKVTETPIMHEDEFLSKLEHHFGISHRQLIPKRV